MAEKSDPFDTAIDIITPENITFQYRVAGPFQRMPAYLIDLLIRFACIAFFWVVFVCSGVIAFAFGLGPFLIAVFLLEWFYGGLFETFWNGQTPGKRLCRLRVVCTDGQPISGMQAVLRNFLRVVDLMPSMFYVATFQVGVFAMSLNDRFQRLGDFVCGTMVVVEEPQRLYGVARVTEPEALRLAGEIPPGFQVGRSLALALSNYVQRRLLFPEPRRLEIAQHLGEPLRVKFDLPLGTNPDMLLCAVYHRTFIDDREEPDAGNPFIAQAEIVR